MEKYKKPAEKQFHVFTDNRDEFLFDKDEAMELAKEWAEEYGCVRVYEDTEWNEYDGIFEDGDCILRVGPYPW